MTDTSSSKSLIKRSCLAAAPSTSVRTRCKSYKSTVSGSSDECDDLLGALLRLSSPNTRATRSAVGARPRALDSAFPHSINKMTCEERETPTDRHAQPLV